MKHKLFIIALLLLFILSIPAFAAEDPQKPVVEAVYFYSNICENCDIEYEFQAMFTLKTMDVNENVDTKFYFYNVYLKDNAALLERYFESYGVPEDQRTAPMAFVGDTYLSGEQAIKDGVRDAFLKVKDTGAATTQIGAVQDEQTEEQAEQISDGVSRVVYFNVSLCRECAKVSAFIETLEDEISLASGEDSKLEIIKYNISDFENIERANAYFDFYDVPEELRTAPIIFVGDQYLNDAEEISVSLPGLLEEGVGLETYIVTSEQDGKSKLDALTWESVAGAFVTGLINGLNPCSLSMLLFFLSMLLMRDVNILKTGFAFIGGKFVAYLLMGFLFYNLLSIINANWVSVAIKVVMLVVIVVLVTLNIQDFFAARREKYDKIRAQLPTGLRKLNHAWMKKITSVENTKLLVPISIGLGALISVGEFLCTGQIFIASIVYVMQNMTLAGLQAAVLFILYGVAFVLPLSALTILIHKGKEIFDMSEFIREKMYIIKLINTIVFIALGIFVLLTM